VLKIQSSVDRFMGQPLSHMLAKCQRPLANHMDSAVVPNFFRAPPGGALARKPGISLNQQLKQLKPVKPNHGS
jgi:hypothetical protein